MFANAACMDQSRAAARTRLAIAERLREPTVLPGRQGIQRTPAPCACGGTCPRCQAKSTLTIGAANDAHEQEADRVADAIMSGRHAEPIGQGSPGLQTRLLRKVLAPDEMYDSIGPGPGDEEAVPEEEAAPASLQRKEAPGQANGESAVSTGYERSLQHAIQGGGSALEPSTRSFMESRFGHDFSTVRVHHDAQADTLSRQVNARAFTVGQDIFFGRSDYAPSSTQGQRLLAHELTHVVQQSSGRLSRQIMRTPLTPCSAYPGYDASVDRHTYNCAGLALRSYKFTSPPSAVYADMWARFSNPVCPVGNCGAGQVKFWLWQYDIRLEDDRGAILKSNWRDFHIVGGRTDGAGNDPTNVYSKNGPRPIHGPGTGPSFRPATRDLALDKNDVPGTTADGRPVYKVRSNMTEEITCAGCA